MDLAFVDREQPRLLQELFDFLSIPSVSSQPAHDGDSRRAAEWLRTELTRLGCPVVDLIEGAGHPVVWAESPVVPGRPTLLIYGHYDVQPADPLEEWESPPFVPTVRDGKLYARGVTDDKGQIFCLLKAYEAVLGEDGRPPLNVHFIFEGEEESGGRVIYDLLHAEPERTRADAVLVSDTSYFAPDLPAVYTAMRGICYAEISVRTLQRDLHSGTYGGVAPNALETLVRILSRLKSADGEIRIPKLYKSVQKPSKKELKAWRKLPFDEEAFLRDEVTAKALTGLEDYSVLERTWALPTLEIHGIRGGFVGEGAKTVIPAQAMAKVSLRLAPGQRHEKVGRQLQRAVARLAPAWADVTVTLLHGGDPAEIAVDHPAFAVLDDAFEEVVGSRTVPVRAGGTIPIVQDLGLTGAPVIVTGISLPDDGLHSPNEKLDLGQLWTGIRVFGRFFELFAQRGGAAPEGVQEGAGKAEAEQAVSEAEPVEKA